MPTDPASPIRVPRTTKSLRELSLEQMRKAIQQGHFKPGQRLVERALCEQLDVSRSVVREVLRHLETEGLVESIPRQGPVVATLSASQAAQVYEVRASLEGRAARLCAERASDAQLARLATLNDRIQDAFKAGDFQEVVARTTAFYEALFASAGLPMVWDIVRTLNARINRLRLMTISSKGRQQEAAGEMARIVDALRRRDGPAAQEQAEAHVRRVAQIASEALAALDAAR